ncbi:gamma-glutamylcyclotransferase [Tumidithrix elongata RA019]|uniref:Gamma-glutamylcyclotransferase n=1 Tax=Tumidithrix elongata BACA0141 TaxID=2716417 RepID=A0AAW9Q0R6_9CYAN|nr:gamma-glutamylcyclotransferase [Tumidithrix elongata RA019]
MLNRSLWFNQLDLLSIFQILGELNSIRNANKQSQNLSVRERGDRWLNLVHRISDRTQHFYRNSSDEFERECNRLLDCGEALSTQAIYEFLNCLSEEAQTKICTSYSTSSFSDLVPTCAIDICMEVWIDLLFDFPSQRLAVYGTLAPGESNHHILKPILGKWYDGFSVYGNLTTYKGYPFLLLDQIDLKTAQPNIKIKLFSSSDLPTHFDRIDAFEGEDYQRVLIPIFDAAGFAIANIYQGIPNG